MKNKDFLIVSINIVALFLCAIFISLIPDKFPLLFGDWHCSGGHYSDGHYYGCQYGPGAHNHTWHWGFRHYLFFLMGLSLFALNVARIIKIMNK